MCCSFFFEKTLLLVKEIKCEGFKIDVKQAQQNFSSMLGEESW